MTTTQTIITLLTTNARTKTQLTHVNKHTNCLSSTTTKQRQQQQQQQQQLQQQLQQQQQQQQQQQRLHTSASQCQNNVIGILT